MIGEVISVSSSVKKASASTMLVVLTLCLLGLSIVVLDLYRSQPDKRLAVIEYRVNEMDKKLDRIDNKLDRVLEQ